MLNSVNGSRPSCSLTWARSEPRSSEWLAALMLDGSPKVDLALLTLSHEPLQLLLEFGVGAPLQGAWCRVLESLDGEIDLPVFLDGHDLGLNFVVLTEVLADVPDVVAVDLGDVDQADSSVFKLEESSVRGDPLYGPFNDRTYLYLCDCSTPSL
jgi:hypothetical protein